MKLHYSAILLVLFAVLLFWPSGEARAQAGDTLTVEWGDAQGIPTVNALRDAIMGDTVAGGARANLNRVYKLKQGGFYWNTERIENNGFHLRLVGEPSGPTALENPPVIQMVYRGDGTIDTRIITGLNSVTLKNLWITGRDENGVQTAYQPIQIDGSDGTVLVDNCVIEYSNFALIAFQNGANNDITITNNKFRNLVGSPSSQQWEGRGISIWLDQKSVIVENNTFFNVGMTAFQIEGGAADYVRFNHNTLVNIGRSVNTGNWFREAYFANNLIVNGFWHGEGSIDYNAVGRNPRAITSGMFSIGALPSKYGPEEGRRILLANTAHWRDPYFTTKYADTIRAQYYVGPITAEDFFDTYDQMVAVDTTWLTERPNFTPYVNAATLDSMWSNITLLRDGITPATPYFFMPTEFPTDVAWPLPENFSYTTPANLLTAGTDGLPLGDLNWFPTQKAQFEANKAQYVSQLEELAGEELVVEVQGTAEAEEGTLGGDAVVEAYGGAVPYFDMDGGGYVRWTFDMPSAGTIKLIISTRSQDARRGQHVRVNGTGLRNDAGSGEYSWYDLPPVEWKEYTIEQSALVEGTGVALDVQAGPNTIEIAPSWGYQEFQWIKVLVGDTEIITLNSTNETERDIIALVTPVVLPYFDMDGGGFFKWTFTMTEADTVELKIKTRSQDARRGQHVRVDGTGLLNDAGFGEYSWFDLELEAWKTYTIVRDSLVSGTGDALILAAGEHTIEIAPSWGYQEFESVQVYANGTLIADLNATTPTLEYEVVAIVSPSGAPPPSGFNSVNLGASGTIAWNFAAAESGNYRLNIFFKTTDAQLGEIKVGGVTVASVSFEPPADPENENYRSVLTDRFPLTAGTQEVTLSGGNINVDLVQFIRDLTVTSVEDGAIPLIYTLEQNYPNPFNPATIIRYSIPLESKVELKVFDILGREVAALVNGVQKAGTYNLEFDARRLASGMYFYRINAGSFNLVRKMLLLK